MNSTKKKKLTWNENQELSKFKEKDIIDPQNCEKKEADPNHFVFFYNKNNNNVRHIINAEPEWYRLADRSSDFISSLVFLHDYCKSHRSDFDTLLRSYRTKDATFKSGEEPYSYIGFLSEMHPFGEGGFQANALSIGISAFGSIVERLLEAYRYQWKIQISGIEKFQNILNHRVEVKKIKILESNQTLHAEFIELVDIWRRETLLSSFIHDQIFHESYQRIIGMGPAILPSIFRRMERQKEERWLWALSMITGKKSDKIMTTEDWLKWGRDQMFI